nr:sodium transport atpase 5 [Quercus suber]
MGRAQPALEQHVSGQANKALTQPPHALPWTTVAEEINADTEDGLNSSEAARRLEDHGRNELGAGASVNIGKILIGQIANAMTLVLIMAMAVSFGIRSWIEGGVVAAVIILNISIGSVQEFKAQKTMDSLRSLSSPTAQTVRDGQSITIATVEIVPGDLVELKTGDTVPADLRIIEAVNFETDEALLTGESLPVRKTADEIFDPTTGPGDRLNIAFSSSTVTKGRATGIVFATGMYTEIGSIAAALRQKNSKIRSVKRGEDGTAKPHRYVQAAVLTGTDAVGAFLGISVGTPLQKRLSRLAVLLFFVAVVCTVIVLGANNFSNRQEVIIYGVATGITDICSDKTGTLTQGKMVAKKAWIPAKGTYTIGETNEPFNPTQGSITFSAKEPRMMAEDESGEESGYSELVHNNTALSDYLRVASLANLANVHQTQEGHWNARGDPTEIAIQVFATRFSWNRRDSVAGEHPSWKMLAEFPFDSEIKKMTVLYRDTHSEDIHVFTKGAVERVITSCTSYVPSPDSDETDMTEDFRNQILENMEGLAKLGLRVLALGSRTYDEHYEDGVEVDRNLVERNLTFRGLVGLYDPPRPESAPSVKSCHSAGIEVHMLTGDHPGTARAIAAQVGILPANMNDLSKDVADSMVMTASQFDALSDDEIDSLPVLPLVIARCAPNTKVRMIDALHRRKKFCAMTGDGVNDSPSLKKADVGIAMGQTGSDVAKDASDIILTDDNFASILAAIEEGRRTFDNIQKFVLHLLSQNVAQALILLIGLVFKDSENLSVFPISPDMGLGFERAAPDVMQRPPQSLKRGVFTIEVMCDMLFYGVWIASLCLGSFVLVLYGFENGEIGNRCNESIDGGCDVIFRARSTCFATLTWFSVFLAWEVIDLRRSFFRMQPGSKRYLTQWSLDIWRNQFLFWAVILGFITIFPILYIPGLNDVVFKHTSISWVCIAKSSEIVKLKADHVQEWAIVMIASLLFFLGVETYKTFKRMYFRNQVRNTNLAVDDPELKLFSRYMTESSMENDIEKGQQ